MDRDNGHHLPLSAIQQERGSALPSKAGGWFQVFFLRQTEPSSHPQHRKKGSGASFAHSLGANCRLFLIYPLQREAEEAVGSRDGPSILTGWVALKDRVARRNEACTKSPRAGFCGSRAGVPRALEYAQVPGGPTNARGTAPRRVEAPVPGASSWGTFGCP